MSELLLSDGTLRPRDVQLATFGRELDGYPDAVADDELQVLGITDPQLVTAG